MNGTADSSQPSARRLRLVHVQLLPLITGVQKVTLEEFTALDRAALEPALVCKEAGPLSKAIEGLEIPVHFVPSLVREIAPARDLAALGGLWRLFRRLRPDVVHTHSSKTGVLGRIAARLAGVPVVVHTVHGFAFPFASSRVVRGLFWVMEYLGARFTDAMIVLNEADYGLATGPLGMARSRVHRIPNGVSTSAFAPLEPDERTRVRREVFAVDADTVVVGMVGRLWRQKNPLCLLEAAEQVVRDTDLNVRFVFLGDGELRADLEARIERSDLADSVQLLGWREDVARLLPALDVFVLPSLWEGMPLAILEAMASAVPVVVSDISGNRDLVNPGVDGSLFPANDAPALAACLEALINDAPGRASMGRAAREKVRAHYSLERRTEAMVALYRELAAGGR